jgi:hypothetical protein
LHLLNSSELPVSFSGEIMHFRCKWTPLWSFPRRALRRDGVGHANPTSTPSSSLTPVSFSPTPTTPLHSGELFRCHRSSLAEGEHTIAFVSSFPFRLVVPVHVWRSSPSNLYLPSLLCSVAVTMTELQSACAAAAGEIRLPPSSPRVSEHLPAICSLSSLRFAP